jgi:hypothetical protein
VDVVFARVESAVSLVPEAVRQQAETLKAMSEQERAHETVSVDANVLVVLMQAADEIAAMKTKQAEKMARRAASAETDTSATEDDEQSEFGDVSTLADDEPGFADAEVAEHQAA